MGSRLVAGVRENPVLICLAVAVVSSAAVILALGSHLTFTNDDWEILLNRRGTSAAEFFDPYHEHIVLVPVVVYKALLASFGMESMLAFQAVSIAFFLLSAVLLFVHLRPRVGEWPALLAAILVLFLGAAVEDLLWPIQIVLFGAVAAALGMLIALERDDQQGDRWACGLLAVSLAFNSIGVAFAVGALVHVLLGQRPRAARAYVVILPLALYMLWWLGWGHNAESHLSWHNLAEMPEYVVNAAAAGITSLLGLASGDGSEPRQPGLVWGQILLVVGVCVAAVRISKGVRVPRDLAVVFSIALAFWVLAGLNATPERLPTSSRYQFPLGIFTLLIAAELLRGVRIGRTAIAAGAVVTAAAVGGGLSLLDQEYEQRWRPAADSLRASLAGVEIARDSVSPDFAVVFSSSLSVSPQTYLSAVDDFGSPAFSETELATRPETDRTAADSTLAGALGLVLTPAAPVSGAGRCQTVQAATALPLSPGGFTLTNEGSGNVEVLLGRFSTGFPVDLGPLAPGSAASLTIPPDRAVQPWRLGVTGEGPVSVC